MTRRLVAIRGLTVVFSATLLASCSETKFPATPSPIVNTPVTTVGGASYSGSITLPPSTSFNMTLIARGLGITPQSYADALAPGNVEITGNYATGTGLTGAVQGTLLGSLQNGSFQGNLISDRPSCTRAYTGVITESGLAWIPVGDVVAGCPLTFPIQIPRPLGPTCSYSPSLSSESFPGAGGSGVATVTAPAGCPWLVESLAPWIRFSDGSAKSGTDTASFNLEPNGQSGARQGQVRVANQTFTVSQAMACNTSVVPTSVAIPNDNGGSAQVTVTAGAGCGWTTQSSVDWIAISPSSGAGNATVTLTAQRNNGPARQGTVTVAGQTVVVSQGQGCSYAVSPTSAVVPSGGGSGTVAVSTAAGCGWIARSNVDWITASPSAGTGSGTVTFAAQPFAGPGRQGTITVAGQTVRVSQGSGCTFAVAPTSFNLPATGGNDTISVTTTAGCGWTAQSNAPWLTVSPSGGSGSGAVTLTALANTGAQRQDTITVAGQTITVIEAALCPYSVSPTSVSLPSGGGQGVVTVTTAAGCAWAAQSNVPWITVNGGGGVGPGRFTYSVVFNVGPGRTGQVLVGLGDPLAVFTVNQALGLGSQPESQE